MLPEQVTTPDPERQVQFSLTLSQLHRKDQFVVNKDLAIRVGKINGEKTAIVIVCPNNTPINLSQLPDCTITPGAKKGDYVFFPLSLTRTQSAQVGTYRLRATSRDNNVNVTIIANKAIKTRCVPRRHDLRKVLANLSSGDNL